MAVFIRQQCIKSVSKSYEDKVSTFTKQFPVGLQHAKSSLCVDIFSWMFLHEVLFHNSHGILEYTILLKINMFSTVTSTHYA
jgi:hypothetical protein